MPQVNTPVQLKQGERKAAMEKKTLNNFLISRPVLFKTPVPVAAGNVTENSGTFIFKMQFQFG